ncbi:superoxide dismutase [Hathewaya histolytica]|uniref:superoxide dismutase n=1 Tax=Hathewaya histolytica TaxID=1498 RepID=A0A4U9RGN0_HATHI|nr:superoxide dismutase [Hathewaya histolytica]VTQ90919.1 superoxide dismutase, Fe [Hathewaya histolytica]
MLQKEKFNFKTVKGISLNQLDQHYELYGGYVNKTNEIWGILDTEKNFGEGNQIYSKMRSLMKGQSFALDGVKLHELYFQNICDSGRGISIQLLSKIKRDFGSFERFEEIFKKTALSVRGWCILTLEPKDSKLHVLGLDGHDEGVVLCSIPLIVLDVYEHAYMIDFGINRKAYIDTFMKTLNWDIVNKRLFMGEKILSHMSMIK